MIAWASASQSPAGTSSAVAFSSTSSGMPPTEVATTGLPKAIASITEVPNPSM